MTAETIIRNETVGDIRVSRISKGGKVFTVPHADEHAAAFVITNEWADTKRQCVLNLVEYFGSIMWAAADDDYNEHREYTTDEMVGIVMDKYTTYDLVAIYGPIDEAFTRNTIHHAVNEGIVEHVGPDTYRHI